MVCEKRNRSAKTKWMCFVQYNRAKPFDFSDWEIHLFELKARVHRYNMGKLVLCSGVCTFFFIFTSQLTHTCIYTYPYVKKASLLSNASKKIKMKMCLCVQECNALLNLKWNRTKKDVAMCTTLSWDYDKCLHINRLSYEKRIYMRKKDRYLYAPAYVHYSLGR